ncbi:MAG TPA: AlkA N-terminal domain-containing protein [Acidimicrobiales bacterium]|nr:AlkA N-terminal domain-containing protein [Acidimicrobiales bacterium]
MDDEHCYRVASGRDGRFDGTFVIAVRTTGIYCRPSCPAMTPKRENVDFYPTPAAAQDAGFRACKRCRPDAAPGSPDWDARADLVARAVRLIGDGVVEREGVDGLSRRLGYSTRQLNRLVTTELGTGPLRLAMAHRVQNARALLETTDLPVTDVAWAAGFGSVRQFNDRVREVFALTPSEIRDRRRPVVRPPGSAIVAQLTYRPPLDLAASLEFLGHRAIPGVETWDGSTYTAAIDLPHGPGLVGIDLAGVDKGGSHPAIPCQLRLTDVRDYATAVSRVRRLLDLDADPGAVLHTFGDDPVLGPLVAQDPGRRLPGTTNPFELAVRAVVGQQISTLAARTVLGRIVARLGVPLEEPGRFAFPTPDAVAGAGADELPMPTRRADTLRALAAAVADGRIALDPGADRDETERRLLELPGVGSWTAAYMRMRGLGDPDVFLPKDLVLMRAAPGVDPAAWKPWRSYAVVHLWATQAAARRGPEPEHTDGPTDPSGSGPGRTDITRETRSSR